MRILVTPRSLTERPHPALERLRAAGAHLIMSRPGQTPREDELLSLVPGISGWLAGVEPVSPAVIAAATSLRCISRNGTGVDNLPLAVLKDRGIVLRTAAGANARGVAELAIALLFSALRHIPSTDQGVRGGGWPRRIGREIKGCRIGIVGFGAVGREVAALALGLGTTVVVHDPWQQPSAATAPGMRWGSLMDVLGQCDVLSLHCPLPANGRPLLDRGTLAALPTGGIVINTARAGLVDEAALIEALTHGQVGCYCTDVFDEEPPRASALLGLANVIATSHIGGYTAESVARATEFAVANLIESLNLVGG
jgi:D-3-phosphoglycerate dehydrogenase